MTQIVKASNAHTVVSTGWTNPSNAFSTTNNQVYATTSPPKNATNSGDFGFPAFTTAELPDHSTLTSVIIRTTWSFTLAVTGETLGMQARRNSTSTTLGTETTGAPLIDTDASQTATGATITDLRTANELRARMRATKGNTSTGVTANLDRVYIEVNFTETVSAAAGVISLTATFAETGIKKTSAAAGSVALVATLSETGKKAALGSAALTLVSTLSESGKKAALGSGAAALTATLVEAGSKQARGAASLAPVASLSEAGRKNALASPSMNLTATLSESGTQSASADVGVIQLSASMTAHGVAAATLRISGELRHRQSRTPIWQFIPVVLKGATRLRAPTFAGRLRFRVVARGVTRLRAPEIHASVRVRVTIRGSTELDAPRGKLVAQLRGIDLAALVADAYL